MRSALELSSALTTSTIRTSPAYRTGVGDIQRNADHWRVPKSLYLSPTFTNPDANTYSQERVLQPLLQDPRRRRPLICRRYPHHQRQH